MTQKEKLARARTMARRIKSLAEMLKFEAKDYDVRFPFVYANNIKEIVDEYLELK